MATVLNPDGTQTSTGRLAVVDSLVSLPGSCALCGKSKSEEGFLTFNGPALDFDFYGCVVFCRDCVGEMAREFGFLLPEDRASLETRLADAEAQLVLHRAAVLNLENSLDSLMALRDSGSSYLNSGPSDVPSAVAPEQYPALDNSNANVSTRKSAKPISSKGSVELPSDLSIDGLLNTTL